MSLVEQIDKDIIKALKGGDKLSLTVLRGLKSDFKYKQIASREPIGDEQAIEVLSSAAKRRRDSIEQFGRGGRDDLVKQEESELALITAYLPKQLSEEELRQMAQVAIDDIGADSPKQMGQVMKIMMPQVKGRADGKMISKLIAELLAN